METFNNNVATKSNLEVACSKLELKLTEELVSKRELENTSNKLEAKITKSISDLDANAKDTNKKLSDKIYDLNSKVSDLKFFIYCWLMGLGIILFFIIVILLAILSRLHK